MDILSVQEFHCRPNALGCVELYESVRPFTGITSLKSGMIKFNTVELLLLNLHN